MGASGVGDGSSFEGLRKFIAIPGQKQLELIRTTASLLADSIRLPEIARPSGVFDLRFTHDQEVSLGGVFLALARSGLSFGKKATEIARDIAETRSKWIEAEKLSAETERLRSETNLNQLELCNKAEDIRGKRLDNYLKEIEVREKLVEKSGVLDKGIGKIVFGGIKQEPFEIVDVDISERQPKD